MFQARSPGAKRRGFSWRRAEGPAPGTGRDEGQTDTGRAATARREGAHPGPRGPSGSGPLSRGSTSREGCGAEGHTPTAVGGKRRSRSPAGKRWRLGLGAVTAAWREVKAWTVWETEWKRRFTDGERGRGEDGASGGRSIGGSQVSGLSGWWWPLQGTSSHGKKSREGTWERVGSSCSDAESKFYVFFYFIMALA